MTHVYKGSNKLNFLVNICVTKSLIGYSVIVDIDIDL